MRRLHLRAIWPRTSSLPQSRAQSPLLQSLRACASIWLRSCSLMCLIGCAHEAPKPAPAPPPVVQEAPPPPRAETDEMKVSGTLGTLDDDEISGPFQRRWDDITR